MTKKVGETLEPLEDFKKGTREFDLSTAMRHMQSGGIQKMWSWGFHAVRTIKKDAIRFRVRGHHHKGYVFLWVAGNDTYSFALTNLVNKISYIETDIYAEDLCDRLDEKIEKIDAYVR